MGRAMNFVVREHGEIDAFPSSRTVETYAQDTGQARNESGSEQLYRAMIEISPQIVWCGRADGYITFVNQHWLTYSDLNVEESLGNVWVMALDAFHRDRLLSAWLEAAPTGRWEIENPFRRWDWEVRWHLARGLAMKDEKGDVVRWIGIAI